MSDIPQYRFDNYELHPVIEFTQTDGSVWCEQLNSEDDFEAADKYSDGLSTRLIWTIYGHIGPDEAARMKHGGVRSIADFNDHADALETYYAMTGRGLASQSTLPPDPECMNGNRAEWADAAIKAFQTETLTDDEDALSDLIGDLMHWADRHLPDGDDWSTNLCRAVDHYEHETEENDA